MALSPTPIDARILVLSGQRVTLDSELAPLYGVPTKALVRAVKRNVEIMRAFVRLRAAVVDHRDLARRLDELEAKYDQQFKVVFDAFRALMTPPEKPARRIGFRAERKH